MEEILKKIVEIDNNAKNIVKEEKEKTINIDEFIESEFNTKKALLDMQYRDEIARKASNYKMEAEEKKRQIEEEANEEIANIERNYHDHENDFLQFIINSIKEEN